MSNWDKLWNRYITTITETEMIQDKEPIQLYVGDLRKVKAEGDKLQKKADKYEEQFLTDSVTLGEVEYMDLMAKAEKWKQFEESSFSVPEILAWRQKAAMWGHTHNVFEECLECNKKQGKLEAIREAIKTDWGTGEDHHIVQDIVSIVFTLDEREVLGE